MPPTLLWAPEVTLTVTQRGSERKMARECAIFRDASERPHLTVRTSSHKSKKYFNASLNCGGFLPIRFAPVRSDRSDRF
jgi:hypothetical protein